MNLLRLAALETRRDDGLFIGRWTCGGCEYTVDWERPPSKPERDAVDNARDQREFFAAVSRTIGEHVDKHAEENARLARQGRLN
jgi:hypothetical protein